MREIQHYHFPTADFISANHKYYRINTAVGLPVEPSHFYSKQGKNRN
jgi:hypothetical protein